jgi:oligopeptide/dipeptide ABC transporter ATP-binding protein
MTAPRVAAAGEDSDAPEILRLEGLNKVFVPRGSMGGRHNGVRALDDVNLTLRIGQTVAIVGESGSGKSTLARVATRLIDPDSGTVWFEGADVTRLRGRQLRSLRPRMQIVFQDPYSALDGRVTVGESLVEPLAVHRRGDRASRRRKAVELLELVGLHAADAKKYPHQFSGGQRQRVCIARALALDPTMVVLDEPVSALDVSTQGQVVNLLTSLQRELSLSYLFVSHDLSVVRHVADRVTVMYLGRVVEEGPVDEIFDRPKHPYTKSLLSAVPVADPHRRMDNRRIVLKGDLPNPSDPPSGCCFHTRCWKSVEVCEHDRPLLRSSGPADHAVACHFPEESDENRR